MRNLVVLFLAGLLLIGPCAGPGVAAVALPSLGHEQAEAHGKAATDQGRQLADIESQIEAKRKETGVPGLSVAIVKDDKLIFAKGFGMRDVERGLPVTADTLMPIGSATKAFTAMAAAISVDQGKLSFDDPPAKYLPYFKLEDPDANAKVKLADMLSHQTGLASYTDLPWAVGTLNRQEVIKVVCTAKPTAPIRTKFQYNNVMYSAAGEVVAAVQKMSWDDAIANLIFKPLQMNASDTAVKEMQKTADFSRGYSYDKEEKTARLVPARDVTDIAAAGAINSNVKDMSRWVRVILNGGVLDGNRLVSEKNYHELVSPHFHVAPKVAYGFGWVLASWHDHATIWHNGGIDGFHSLVEMMPDQHLGFVILSNTGDSPLEGPFADIIFSNLVPGADESNASGGATGSAGAPLTEAAVKELTGSYKVAGLTAKIADVNGATSLVVPGQPAYPLMQKDKDLLVSPALPTSYSVTVKRDASGKVSGLTIKQPGVNTEMVRASDYSAPISATELINKAIDALGGEAVLRKHTSESSTASVDLINQGVTGEANMFRRAPNSEATRLTFDALGRKIGYQRVYFDGSAGATESSFSQTEPWNKSKIETAKAQGDFNELLDAKTIFKDIAITGTEKVNGEEAYIVALTPASGTEITEYYSTKSSLMLRRDTAGDDGPTISYYSDYRAIDGQMVPFKVVEEPRAGGQIIMLVTDVKFNTPISDSEFKPKP